MSILLRASAAAILLATISAPASAVVLDFNNYRPAGSSNTATTSIYGPIVEDGFRVSSSTCEAPSQGRPLGRCFVTEQGRNSSDPTGAAIKTSFAGQTITVEKVDGAAFIFDSIDIGSRQGSNPLTIDFFYTLLDGTTGSKQFAIPTSTDLLVATYSIADLGPITSIRFDPSERNGAFQFDNIRLSEVPAVPEPASWAMMIGGFAIAGGVLRRAPSRRLHAA
jgi:hypothetical protein